MPVEGVFDDATHLGVRNVMVNSWENPQWLRRHIYGEGQGRSVHGSSSAGLPGKKGLAAGTAIPPGR